MPRGQSLRRLLRAADANADADQHADLHADQHPNQYADDDAHDDADQHPYQYADDDATPVLPQQTPTPSVHPGTIGFWRNHSSAIGALLPQNIGSSPTGGDANVTTVAEALTVLNSTACNGANAIRCMGAQLLATLLDIAANPSLDHSCVDSDITAARNLLAAVGWSATSLTASERQQALMLAGNLDAWNNAGCP
jgi:hypothetical protein